MPCVVVAAYRGGKLENLANCDVVCMSVCVVRVIDISDFKSLLVCVWNDRKFLTLSALIF